MDPNRLAILLVDDNRPTRIKALKDVKQTLLSIIEQHEQDFDLSSIHSLVPQISSCLDDTSETIRELTIEIFTMLISHCSDDSLSLLPSLLPMLVKRLGSKDVVEASEELRLQLVLLVQLVVDKYLTHLNAYADDLVSILSRTLADNFSDIKKLSANLTAKLSVGKLYQFAQRSNQLLNPLLSNCIHQHSKIRLTTIQALGIMILNSVSKPADMVEKALPVLTQRLFDSAVQVRRAVCIDVVGRWLLDLPDRYSFHTKLLPLFLSGLIDEDSGSSQSLVESTAELWHEIGCRELVHRSASRLLPALCRDLADWQEATRRQASSLLPILTLHLERVACQHTQALLTGLSSGLTSALTNLSPGSSLALLRLIDPNELLFRGTPFLPQLDRSSILPGCLTRTSRGADQSSGVRQPIETMEALVIIKQLMLTARLAASSIDTSLWWHLLRPLLDRCCESNAPSSLAAHLFLLAGLISGSSLPQLMNPASSYQPDQASDSDQVTGSLLSHLAAHLTQPDPLQSVAYNTKAALLECLVALVDRIEHGLVITLSDPHDPSSLPGDLPNWISGQPKHPQADAMLPVYEQAASQLIADESITHNLFHAVQALMAVWADQSVASNAGANNDFGAAMAIECSLLIGRLAACERCRMRRCLHLTIPHDLDPQLVSDLSLAASKVSSSEQGGTRLPIDKATHDDLDRLYAKHMPQILADIEKNQTPGTISNWHPRSLDLALFERCIISAGSSLLLQQPSSAPNSFTLLDRALRLLSAGCRLGKPLGSDTASKTPGSGLDPMTVAAEAELRLRGILLLTRLTDNPALRSGLSTPGNLEFCLNSLLLPACSWRAGRTCEALRKTAVTSIVALLASASSVFDLTKSQVDSRTRLEIGLDNWLVDNLDSVKQLLGSKTTISDKKAEKPVNSSTGSNGTLPLLNPKLLSTLLARLGTLLDDDCEATRRMTCLACTLLFNGLLARPLMTTSSGCGDDDARFDLLSSPGWNQPIDRSSADQTQPSELCCPLPGSLGDQVYRFYPSLIQRLNDCKDQIRLIASESFNAWIRLVERQLTTNPDSDQDASSSRRLNPVHSAVVEDLIDQVLPHLDDPSSAIQAALARILTRVAYCLGASDIVQPKLATAEQRFRSGAVACRRVRQCIEARL